MIKVRHVDFYADEWLVGTMGLSVVDVGVYIQACALIYSRGGPIEMDDLRRFVVCHGNAFRAALRRLANAGKLTISGSIVSSIRCESTLETTRKRLGSWSENGGKGGRPRKDINDLPKPNGSLARANGNQEPNKDSLREEGEGLGRDAPLGEAVEVTAAAETPEPVGPAAAAPPPDDDDFVAVDEMVANAKAALAGKRTRIHDPVAYQRSAEAAKWQNWLATLHPCAGRHLRGSALWKAYEAISAAQSAGSREATPRQVRDVLNGIARLRNAEQRVAA